MSPAWRPYRLDTDGTGDRTGQGLPATVPTTMHMVDAHASLCCRLLLREQRSMGSNVWDTVASESVPRTNNSL